MSKQNTCAACGGGLKIEDINTIWWEGHAIDLCVACLCLGDETTKSLPVEEIEELLQARADPKAPRTGFEATVRSWIIKRYGPSVAIPRKGSHNGNAEKEEG